MRYCLFVLMIGLSIGALAQDSPYTFFIQQASGTPLAGATAELLSHPQRQLLKIAASDSGGKVQLQLPKKDSLVLKVSYAGFETFTTPPFTVHTTGIQKIILQPTSHSLANVTVTARKPFIELQANKTVVNLDAVTTSVGSTALEALEKMPGITVDKDGNIALKGRAGVLVLLDGKQTFLDGNQLSTLLSGMSASQISQVEIMDQPSARYDAAGNAGVINIKTKKNLQRGFNASITTAYTQGVYPKANNSLQLNFRSGAWNVFASYSGNIARNFTRIYALRRYIKPDGSTASYLEQPSLFTGRGHTHNFRTGIDYTASSKTSLGVNLTGLVLSRDGGSSNPAHWMNAQKQPDSSLITESKTRANWNNAGANFYLRHSFNANRQLAADVDVIGYRIEGQQFFQNQLLSPNGYTEANRAALPSTINIVSAKADYTEHWKGLQWETGIKVSNINTDNLADYEKRENGNWQPDLNKSNHFLYRENIGAVYGNAQWKNDRWTLESGLRYENTSYDAHQLGNSRQKDSAFSRSYGSFFPSFSASLQADSNNSFAFAASRRIDRPAFQKLNPFVIIINKYTYQQGNPFFRPQFTWNMQLSHSYKNRIITSIGYSVTTDYFSQIFPIDSSGLVIYTEGNLDRLQHFTLSVGGQLNPASWWSLNGQATLVHKTMEGFIGKSLEATVTQLQLNLNNQLKFKKGWTGELSGFFTSRSQADIQEIVDPAGQLSIGVAKAVLQNKGTLRLAFRDLLYTQWMKGNTYFPGAHEYFKLTRDTRTATISFTYRFGKTFKTTKRSEGAASEEIQRVGNG